MSDALELLWQEIEVAPKPARSGWVRRLANPGARVPVHAAVASINSARSLLIDISVSLIGRLQMLPQTSALLVRLLPPLEGQGHDVRTVALELEDARFNDLFTVFCRDLLDEISRCTTGSDAVVLLLRRLGRWQELLNSAAAGLSRPQVVGLIGELSFLRDVLIPIGGTSMVDCWTGAQRSPQDFIVPGVCGIEIKTSEARVLSHIRIHGERQLDDTGLVCLFLGCLRVEADAERGESLNDLVDHLRSVTARTPEFALTLGRLLADAGYLDRHRHRYEALRLRVAERRFFRVDGRFPRLVGAGLPAGLDDVDYRMDLRACTGSECALSEVTANLNDLNFGRPSQ